MSPKLRPFRLQNLHSKVAPSVRNRRGSVIIEFALVALIFLGLMFAVFDLGRLFYVEFVIHSAVREASRFTVTGNVLPDPNNPGKVLSRIDSIIARLQRAAPGLGVEVARISVIGPAGPGDPGGPGDLVTIRVDYDIELLTPVFRPLFPNATHRYSVSLVSQNEPFSS
ncbi:MAG TPA: TadE family protein [Candidatus Krumholzibacteria bacterium]|nr:TadE family protein [Candidatus Krumholzibacteria bacterium]